MIKVGDIHINPAHVSHMKWNRRHYMNGTDNVLVITMADGSVIRHEGSDVFEVEHAILKAMEPKK